MRIVAHVIVRGDESNLACLQAVTDVALAHLELDELKEDQATAGADVAVLVCSALPSDVRHMECVDGISRQL